jgi:hypothetical protein
MLEDSDAKITGSAKADCVAAWFDFRAAQIAKKSLGIFLLGTIADLADISVCACHSYHRQYLQMRSAMDLNHGG